MTGPHRIPIEEEIASRGIQLRRVGAEMVGPCPVCGGIDRFSINRHKQVWHCRGCAKGGDVIDLVQHIDGCGYLDALRILNIEERRQLQPAVAPAASRPDDDLQRKCQARAMDAWNAATPIAGTLADTYLASRRLSFSDPDGDVLRFSPVCVFGHGTTHPCMVALFRNILTNEPQAIHRTALSADGKKIDRKALGPIAGAAIKLSDDADVTMGLHIAEGIETTLAAMALGFSPAWALGAAGGIAKFQVLGRIEALTILVDHDKPDERGRQAGHAAARECADRWIAAGREVRSVVPRRIGADMADLVRP